MREEESQKQKSFTKIKFSNTKSELCTYSYCLKFCFRKPGKEGRSCDTGQQTDKKLSGAGFCSRFLPKPGITDL